MSSIDASPPPRRCATRAPRRAARREEDGGGRPPRAQQAFHASAGIVKGGESFAENSDPWVASDRGRQHSYPVSRPLAHRLHSSYQAAFEAALMSCRIVGRLRWVGGRHGGCRARRATRRGRQAEPRQGPIASAHGSRCRAAGSAADACTSSTRSRHPTRAIGEVVAPVAVVAQPFGYGGERARLGRAVADAPVEHGGGIVGRDESMQFGGPAKYARRVLAVERPQRETTAQGG